MNALERRRVQQRIFREAHPDYHKKYMVKFRNRQRKRVLAAKGKCPVCTMILSCEHHKPKYGCSYFVETKALLPRESGNASRVA